jgi:hypothetical protein
METLVTAILAITFMFCLTVTSSMAIRNFMAYNNIDINTVNFRVNNQKQ